MNQNCELTFDELNEVAGGGWVDLLKGAILGEIVHYTINGGDHFPTQVLNGLHGAIGQKPV